MGANVHLVSAVTSTPISSSSHNANMTALNTAGGFTFTKGSLTQWVAWGGAGFGTYSPGMSNQGKNIAGCFIQYAVTVDNGFWNLATYNFGHTTVTVSANQGSSFLGTAWTQ